MFNARKSPLSVGQPAGGIGEAGPLPDVVVQRGRHAISSTDQHKGERTMTHAGETASADSYGSTGETVPERADAVVVGAGFAGLYMVHRLRDLGMSVIGFEAGDDVGGTWYWNRYPGARCDAESLAYSFSFSGELEQSWSWTERYASQPEILRYARHVADRFDLRRTFRFGRRVESARFDEQDRRWLVTSSAGDAVSARLCIMATGCLSVPQVPDIPGLEEFAGERYQASLWPHEPVSFAGKRVGVIGTGSSAIQAIPVIAEEADRVVVFQRTPNFSVPARNEPLEDDFVEAFKRHYREHRRLAREGKSSGFGGLEPEPKEQGPAVESATEAGEAELEEILEQYWQTGGARFIGAIGDTLLDERANELVAEFVRNKIRSIVRDPATAERLCPRSHPIGTKRICVDTGYYETFNRDNVELVDLTGTPIEAVTRTGVRTAAGEWPLDMLILATGFDAMTGALRRIDIRGRGGRSLADHWRDGPRAYLGLAIAGFPNLFTITGPGSPSVLSNMLVSIEQHVDWIVDCLKSMADRGAELVEADPDAESHWVDHVNDVAGATLFPRAGSWYMGANVPGKPRVFMPYAAGVGAYREVCEQIAAEGYRGLRFA
jgi:cyclohexanone monooxygenase